MTDWEMATAALVPAISAASAAIVWTRQATPNPTVPQGQLAAVSCPTATQCTVVTGGNRARHAGLRAVPGAVAVTLAVDALLVLLVAVTWLGCIGFTRLRTPLDRLHCAAFVNVAAGLVLVAVAFLADGASTRAWKVLLTVLAGVLGGAALSHAAGRALLYRERFRGAGPPA